MHVKKGRPLFKAQKKPYSTIFVHSHSHAGGLLDPAFQVVPADQAHDANAILLGGRRDVVVTSLPVESSYISYWTETLKLSEPLFYTLPPAHFKGTTLQSLLHNVDPFIGFLKEQKAKGLLKDTLVLSVFEADETDKELLSRLQHAEVGHVISECNYDLLDLGTKTTWRTFCKANGIPQLPGGVFHTIDEVLQFTRKELAHHHSVVLKSPHGIGGLGQLRIIADPQRVKSAHDYQFDDEQLSFIRHTLANEKEILAERFANRSECEQVVDVYIDPILPGHCSSVIFDQLTKEPTQGSGGIAYYGAKYPSVHLEAKAQLCSIVKESLMPALVRTSFTGPAGIDVMYRPPHPPHFVELNMRTDAITYIKHLSDRVGKALYEKEAGQMAFMTLVNLPHTLSFSQIRDTFASVLQPSEEGVFVCTNPNRHRWGSYDVAAISPLGLHVAERLMKRSLQAIWGDETARTFRTNIQRHPIPLLARQGGPGGAYPYLVSLPHDYDDTWDTDKTWPAILFLHGMDERGSDLSKVRQHGIPKAVQEHKDFPFISISPQCPEGEEHWDVARLAQLLDQAMEEFRADPKRVYLTGCSMGGEGVWRLALASPHRFAAIAPVCGDAPSEALPNKVERIKAVPAWVFHGVKDNVVPFDDSVKMVTALQEAGAGHVKFTQYEDTAHDAWTDTYNNPLLYDWFLQNTNEEAAPRQ
jgi:pimeloyl-ACP methyl ester carboxylesterase